MTSHALPLTAPLNIVTTAAEHFERLRAELRGDLLLPGEPGWDDARSAWQLMVDQHPVAVVAAADAADVATTVKAARRLGLHVAPQCTDHAAGTLDALGDTILLRTSRLDRVEISPEAWTAHVGAGVVASALAAAAAAHGLAADGVLAIEAVDAQGRMIRIDATRHPELFWAARGGIAPVVVTAIELRLHPTGEVHAGALLWPLEREHPARAADLSGAPVERLHRVAHAWDPEGVIRTGHALD